MRITLAALLVALSAAAASGEEYFVPMVAQKQGQDGAWWNTEVWIANGSADTGGFAVVFLPAGRSNAEALREEPAMEDLPPGATVYRNDLVPQGMVGALRVLTTPGVAVFARVFNSAGKGSFGEGMPALPRSAAMRPGEVGQLVGLRRTPQFRTNLGLLNPTAEPGTVRVRLFAQRGELLGEQPFRLEPGAYLQLDDVLHAFAVGRGEHLRAEVSGDVPFFAFASVIDARSGAPTLIPALR
ncbi:MAG: hypothetical protein ACM3O7_03275 [Acidobacteriota bacterium]